MKNIKIYTLLLIALFAFNSYAQVEGISPDNPRFFVDQKVITPFNAASVISDLDINKPTPPLLMEVTSKGQLYLKLDLGENFVLKSPNGGDFEVKLDLKYKLNTNSIYHTIDFEINSITPEQLHIIDLSNDLPGNTAIEVSIDITGQNNGLAISTSGSDAQFLTNLINNNLRLTTTFVREYKTDVRLASNGNFAPFIFLTQLPDQLNKRVHFSWNTNGYAYPNYEIQVLRIFNEDSDNLNPGIANNVKIDWSKALSIETQSYKTEIDLIVAEGKGWYTWRVRPIGSYYEGGVGNSDNYGVWSSSFMQGSVVDFGAGGTATNAFYLIDNDDQKNWNYTRVFTEGDETGEQGMRTSEGMTYADGLLRTRQSQQYNSTNETTIVSQTISDYSGRPALTTLPVPVSGDLNGYKESFVQSSTGTTVYTAKNYDTDTKIQNPDKIKDIGTSFEYYNGERSDGVADAEEYSFSRTIFKTDGTGRATESSGVGKKHAIGDGSQNQGGGKTTNVLYSSPSDAELIRIFGDEAPLAESVIKTVTSDPNDVISLAYTSKEGKTIATALISNQTSNLEKLEGDINDNIFAVDNTTDQNVLSFNKFVSSKRIAIISDGTEVDLDYKITELNGAPCGDGGCNYKVRFYLNDLTNNIQYKSNPHTLPNVGSSIDFNVENLIFTNIYDQSIFVSSTDGTFNLNVGEYLITKEIYSLTNANSIASAAMIRADLIEDILLDITDRMDAVNNQDDLDDFILYLEDTLPNINNFPIGFSVVYNTVTNALDITNNGDTSGDGGSCQDCATSSVTIPKPEICEVCEGESLVDELGATLIPIETIRNNASSRIEYLENAPQNQDWSDLKKVVDNYFIKYLEDKLNNAYPTSNGSPLTEVEIQEKLRILAPGFTKESLAYMITNMLASKYYTGNTIDVSGVRYRAAENAIGKLERIDADGDLEIENSGDFNVAILASDLADEYNYEDCEELYLCWTQAVDIIGSFEFADEDIDLMDAYNAENEEVDGGESSDDHADNEDSQEGGGNGNALLDWIISRKMRNSDANELSQGAQEALVSLPNLFLNCTGYQFADIIDDAKIIPSTIPSDYDNDTPYSSNPSFIPVLNDVFSTGLFNSNLGDFPTKMGVFSVDENNNNAIIFTPEEVTECDPDPNDNIDPASYERLNYPYVVKPEWMFKYFVYNAHGNTTINDADNYIVTQHSIEISSNYNELTGCAPTPLCFEVNQYDHNDWSAGQRLNFYQQIKGGKKTALTCVYADEVNNTPTPLDLTEVNLLTLVKAELEDALLACENNRGEIRNGLITALEGACYELVETCDASGTQVNELGLDGMVDQVVNQCISKVHTVRDKIFVDENMTIDLSSNTYYAGAQYGADLLGPLHTAAPNTTPEFPYYEIISCCAYDETGTAIPSSKRKITLFADCDQAILDQVNNWYFVPYIQALPGCNNATTAPWNTCPDGDCGVPNCIPSSSTNSSTYATEATSIDASTTTP